ncbi:NUDIX hydrolase [Lyngbya confervoides]|uniref:NUDIX hydrolase n=1 Tax=Lyngbya confervoides BDU141951 TaxID=1574623 RepID=A0ABD4T0Y1_9CYAN|nr:NUDIX hydrolase [Lyngbya confervoides]MCM1982431.1 NUDIX hydrolase [Lyngbya confervoides BDU141951]
MSIYGEPPELLEQAFYYRARKFSFEANRLRLPNQSEGLWACVRHPGGAMVVPITASGELVLVKQYRFALAGRILEFPAGTLEVGEDPAVTVQRELEEETGYRGHRWTPLGTFPLAPGYSDELIYAYLATDLEPLDHPPAQDEDEDIEVVLMSPQALEQAILAGEPLDAKTMAGFTLARPYLAL